MNTENTPKWLQWMISSTGSGISLRIKSFLGGALAIATLNQFGIDSAGLSEGIDMLFTVIGSAGLALSGFYQLIGWIRNKSYKRARAGKFAEF